MKKKKLTKKQMHNRRLQRLMERKIAIEHLEDALNQSEVLIKNQFHRLNTAQQRIISFILATGVDPFHVSLPVSECYPNRRLINEIKESQKKLENAKKDLRKIADRLTK